MAAFAGHYGLGWVVGAYGGQRLIWHSGGTLGFTSLVSFLPEADLGVVVLTNGAAGTAGPFTYAVTFRLLELLFDQPAAFDAQLAASVAGAAQGRTDLLAHLGQVDPAAVGPYLGRYANPDLGPVTLALRAGTLMVGAGAFRSELRPRLDEDGAVAGYVLVDPPLGGYPPQATLTFEQSTGGQPRLVLTVPADPGEADLVYAFDPVDATATPTP
jgi:hypothetical protein